MATWLGEYELRADLGREGDLVYYEAFQPSINRTVALVLLDAPEEVQEQRRQELMEVVRLRAAHPDPYLAAVYEVNEDDGFFYYTRELLSGERVDEWVQQGRSVSEAELLRLVDATIGCCARFERAGLALRPLKESLFYHEPEVGWRMLHPLTGGEPRADHMPRALEMLTSVVRVLHPAESELKAGLVEAAQGVAAGKIRGWAELEEFWAQHRRRWGLSLNPPGRPARRRRGRWLGVGIAAVVLAGLVATGLWLREQKRFESPALAAPVVAEVAGEGQLFWLAAHEATIGEYLHFLGAAAAQPGAFDEPDQPGTKLSHTPPGWEEVLAAIQQRRAYRGVMLGYDFPVFNVDYWDAAAFARWRGGRLPEEAEWQLAAAGCTESAATAGAGEGPIGWVAVDQAGTSGSGHGLRGLAGNVAEWTRTFDTSTRDPGSQTPVIRGGDFTQLGANGLKRRLVALRPEDRELFVGVRVLYDRLPGVVEILSPPSSP